MATSDPPFAQDALGAVLAPIGRSRTFPAEAYTSEEVFTWEQERFFEGSWVCVGRSADLSEPGTRWAVRIGTQGILLVRDETRQLRAFSNVCRHRGHELLPTGDTAQGRVIRCPYHAWVYDLDGSLRGAPSFSEIESFDRSEFPLIEGNAAEWRGWVFVNASAHASPLAPHIGNLDEILSAYEPERLSAAARSDYVVEANWKLLSENYHECYHCSSIHPELCRVTPIDSGVDLLPDGAWAGGTMELMDHAQTMSLTGESNGVVLRGLDDRRRREVIYAQLFPNLLISAHPDYVMTHRLEPLSPGRTRVECEWLFPPEAYEREAFDPAYAVDFWDLTNRQDWAACESVQRGAGNRGFRPGPLSSRESTLYQLLTMLAKGYLTGRVDRPNIAELRLTARD